MDFLFLSSQSSEASLIVIQSIVLLGIYGCLTITPQRLQCTDVDIYHPIPRIVIIRFIKEYRPSEFSSAQRGCI